MNLQRRGLVWRFFSAPSARSAVILFLPLLLRQENWLRRWDAARRQLLAVRLAQHELQLGVAGFQQSQFEPVRRADRQVLRWT